ncbi:MAG: hypothetical protein JSS20_12035 [Proteobacteria bacterium]|nr:hypothetical protein [Pseudomonadota bacterium]
MTEQQMLSSFSLNPRNASTDQSRPKMTGRAEIVFHGKLVPYTAAVWGPYTSEGGQDYYRLSIRPVDPELAAKQDNMANGSLPTPRPVNAPVNYDESKARAGTGALFPTSEDERATARTKGPDHIRMFYGQAVVLLPDGSTSAIDPSAFARYAATDKAKTTPAWYSGNADHHDPEAAAAARAAKTASAPARPGSQANLDRAAKMYNFV